MPKLIPDLVQKINNHLVQVAQTQQTGPHHSVNWCPPLPKSGTAWSHLTFDPCLQPMGSCDNISLQNTE